MFYESFLSMEGDFLYLKSQSFLSESIYAIIFVKVFASPRSMVGNNVLTIPFSSATQAN